MPAKNNARSGHEPEESGPPMPPPVGDTWEMFLAEELVRNPSEVDLKTMRAGDRLIVGTRNTRYEFEWREDGTAHLSADRADRPWGVVTVAGCIFRRSGVLAPGVLFCGGKLEFASTKGQVRHHTTLIRSLEVIRAGSPARQPVDAQLGAR